MISGSYGNEVFDFSKSVSKVLSADPMMNGFGGRLFKHDGKIYGYSMNNTTAYGKSLNLVTLELGDNPSIKLVTTDVLPSLPLDKYHTLTVESCSKEREEFFLIIDGSKIKRQPIHASHFVQQL